MWVWTCRVLECRCGHVEVLVCGCVDVGVQVCGCGYVGVLVCGCGCGSASVWMWTCGSANVWVWIDYRLTDQPAKAIVCKKVITHITYTPLRSCSKDFAEYSGEVLSFLWTSMSWPFDTNPSEKNVNMHGG